MYKIIEASKYIRNITRT